MSVFNLVRKSESYIPPTWSGGTDEEIVEALEKHYAGEVDLTEYWNVGDERVVTLDYLNQMAALNNVTKEEYMVNEGITSEEEANYLDSATLVLVEKTGKTLYTPINNHTEAAFTWQTKELIDLWSNLSGSMYVIPAYKENFTILIETYLADFPSEALTGDAITFPVSTAMFAPLFPTYINNISKIITISMRGTSNTTSTEEYEKFGVPAFIEVSNSTEMDSYYYYQDYYSIEGNYWSYYNDLNNRVKYANNYIQTNGNISGSYLGRWLLRTGYYDSNILADGSLGTSATKCLIAPFGCI